MGQQVGKCSVVKPIQPFVNLSHDACLRLWEAFHDIAEGFGLQCDESQEICETLLRDMACEREELDTMVELMFHVMDTDENGLIDALEFMVTLALFSGIHGPARLDGLCKVHGNHMRKVWKSIQLLVTIVAIYWQLVMNMDAFVYIDIHV